MQDLGNLMTRFCTIGDAASLVAGGATVRVLAGTYPETVKGTHSGTPGT
jgi:hypothetical protein